MCMWGFGILSLISYILKEFCFRFIFYRKFFTQFKPGKSKNIMFFLNGIAHDILESSHYISHECLHMRTTEINLNSGATMAPKKTDNAKKSTADAQAFEWIVFERRVGQ